MPPPETTTVTSPLFLGIPIPISLRVAKDLLHALIVDGTLRNFIGHIHNKDELPCQENADYKHHSQ